MAMKTKSKIFAILFALTQINYNHGAQAWESQKTIDSKRDENQTLFENNIINSYLIEGESDTNLKQLSDILKTGVNVNDLLLLGTFFMTPLNYVLMTYKNKNQLKYVNLLLEHGADTNLGDDEQLYPLDICIDKYLNSFINGSNFLDSLEKNKCYLELIRYLLWYNAKIHTLNLSKLEKLPAYKAILAIKNEILQNKKKLAKLISTEVICFPVVISNLVGQYITYEDANKLVETSAK